MRGRELRARGGDLPPLSVFCVCVWLPTPLTRRHAGRNEPRTDAALCGEKSWKSGFRRTTTQPWPSDLASMAPAHTANLTRDTTTDQKTLPRAHQSAPRAHQTDVVFPPRSDGDPFPTCVTVEVGRPIAGARVLGAEMFVPRAGLSARQPNVPSRRSASPIAEARSPKAAPSGSTSRSLQTPCPRFFLASQVCQTLAIQSLLEHSSPIEDACTSSWESHRWVLRRGFSSSRTSRADASVVSNGPTRDLTPARDGLVIARTHPTSRRATNEECTPASADVLTVRLTASQSSPVMSNEQM